MIFKGWEEIKKVSKESGWEVYAFKQVSSTMDIAKKLALSGEKALVFSETQTKGRGRHGRTWISLKGGLWLSLSFLFPKNKIFLLPYLLSLSMCETLRDLTKIKIFLKWPNDLILIHNEREKKLGGILIELLNSERPEMTWVIAGIGVNVNNQISEKELHRICKEETFLPPVSLKEVFNQSFDLKKILLTFLYTLNKNFLLTEKEILETWQKYSLTIGRKVKIILSEGKALEGEALCLSSKGELIVKVKKQILPFSSGECLHLR